MKTNLEKINSIISNNEKILAYINNFDKISDKFNISMLDDYLDLDSRYRKLTNNVRIFFINLNSTNKSFEKYKLKNSKECSIQKYREALNNIKFDEILQSISDKFEQLLKDILKYNKTHSIDQNYSYETVHVNNNIKNKLEDIKKIIDTLNFDL